MSKYRVFITEDGETANEVYEFDNYDQRYN